MTAVYYEEITQWSEKVKNLTPTELLEELIKLDNEYKPSRKNFSFRILASLQRLAPRDSGLILYTSQYVSNPYWKHSDEGFLVWHPKEVLSWHITEIKKFEFRGLTNPRSTG